MIELLLVAGRLLAAGDLDRAERIYLQVVEADPRNAIAVVGLAQVAHARGFASAAKDFLSRALDIDPQDQAAQRLAMEWADGPATSGHSAAAPAVADMPAAAAAPELPAALASPPAGQLGPGPSLLARIRAWLGLRS